MGHIEFSILDEFHLFKFDEVCKSIFIYFERKINLFFFIYRTLRMVVILEQHKHCITNLDSNSRFVEFTFHIFNYRLRQKVLSITRQITLSLNSILSEIFCFYLFLYFFFVIQNARAGGISYQTAYGNDICCKAYFGFSTRW